MWCLANTYPPWEAYMAIVEGQLIGLDKFPGVCPVRIREIFQRILGNCVLKAYGKYVNHTCGVQLSFILVIFLPWISPYFLIRDMGGCSIVGKASMDINEAVFKLLLPM